MGWFSNDSDAAGAYSDEELLAFSQTRPWLFGILIDRYEAAFLRKATSIVRDPRDAEEIVQDTFTKIYKYAHTYEPRPGASFSSWAYRILHNTACTYYQRRVRHLGRYTELDPEFEAVVADDGQSPLHREREDGVERVLSRLPEHFAHVLRRHYLERWPQEAIAAETGEGVGTIKVRMFRAKAAFRKLCREEGHDIAL